MKFRSPAGHFHHDPAGAGHLPISLLVWSFAKPALPVICQFHHDPPLSPTMRSQRSISNEL